MITGIEETRNIIRLIEEQAPPEVPLLRVTTVEGLHWLNSELPAGLARVLGDVPVSICVEPRGPATLIDPWETDDELDPRMCGLLVFTLKEMLSNERFQINMYKVAELLYAINCTRAIYLKEPYVQATA